MISARAMGVYLYVVESKIPISADRLSEIFTEGREAMRATLNELRSLGLIKTTKGHFGGKIFTVNEFVETASWDPETRQQLQQCKHNSQLAYTPYSSITSYISSYANSRTEVREKEETRVLGVNVAGWDNVFDSSSSMDRDEFVANIKKNQKSKKETYDLEKEKQVKKNNFYRNEIPISDWSPKHVCQEFSNRIWTMHIKPWNLNASRFIQSMGTTRKKYNTTGEVELKVMDAFFAKIELSRYSDPEHLWRLFLHMFPQLLKDAKFLVDAPNLIQQSSDSNDKFWSDRGL